MKKTIVSARIDKIIYEFDEYDIKNALIKVHGFPVGWTQNWEFFDYDDGNKTGVKLIISRTKDEQSEQETL